MNQALLRKICYHRGFGPENTLSALSTALDKNPFMLEFDVQLYDGTLHLGHPPVVNTEETLKEALALYPGTIIPKIDLKLKNQLPNDLAQLKKDLTTFNRLSLVNLGDVENEESLSAETAFTQLGIPKALLNLDLQRYSGLSEEQIEGHISNIKESVFSISPNLKDDFKPSVRLAKKFNIQHIHFWAYENDIYNEPYLLQLINTLSDEGFEVYFDISLKNVAKHALDK